MKRMIRGDGHEALQMISCGWVKALGEESDRVSEHASTLGAPWSSWSSLNEIEAFFQHFLMVWMCQASVSANLLAISPNPAS